VACPSRADKPARRARPCFYRAHKAVAGENTGVSPAPSGEGSFSPADVLLYIYGVLQSPTYRSSPQLCSRPDVHIGFHPTYEFADLVPVEDVVGAVRTTME